MRYSANLWLSSLFVSVLAALLLLGAAQDDAKPQVADAKDAKPSATSGYDHGEEGSNKGRYEEGEYYHAQEQHYRDDTPHHNSHHHEKKWCCSCPLPFTKLTDKIGCTPRNGACESDGEFCENAFCNNCNPDFEFCKDTNLNGAEGDLCYQVTCPGIGTLRVQATLGDLSCCGGDNSQKSVRLFKGSYTAAGVFNNVIKTVSGVNNQQTPFNATVPCTPGQKYELCEIDHIFLKAATKFTFTSRKQGQCASGCTTVKCGHGDYHKNPY